MSSYDPLEREAALASMQAMVEQSSDDYYQDEDNPEETIAYAANNGYSDLSERLSHLESIASGLEPSGYDEPYPAYQDEQEMAARVMAATRAEVFAQAGLTPPQHPSVGQDVMSDAFKIVHDAVPDFASRAEDVREYLSTHAVDLNQAFEAGDSTSIAKALILAAVSVQTGRVIAVDETAGSNHHRGVTATEHFYGG